MNKILYAIVIVLLFVVLLPQKSYSQELVDEKFAERIGLAQYSSLQKSLNEISTVLREKIDIERVKKDNTKISEFISYYNKISNPNITDEERKILEKRIIANGVDFIKSSRNILEDVKIAIIVMQDNNALSFTEANRNTLNGLLETRFIRDMFLIREAVIINNLGMNSTDTWPLVTQPGMQLIRTRRAPRKKTSQQEVDDAISSIDKIWPQMKRETVIPYLKIIGSGVVLLGDCFFAAQSSGATLISIILAIDGINDGWKGLEGN